MTQRPILLIEDEACTRSVMAATLDALGLGPVAGCASLAEARTALATTPCSLVLLDLMLPDGAGETLLGEILVHHPGLPVVVVTGVDEVATAVRCMRAKADDYLVKPVGAADLEFAVRGALARRALEAENRELAGLVGQDGLHHPDAFAGLLTMDPGMLRLLQYAEIIAPGPHPVLISGEPGTGRSTLARAVHRLSGRRGGLVAVRPAGRDDTACADELFGHRRGALPGASSERLGLIQQAEGGTLAIDGLADLGEAMQARLLQLCEDRTYLPVGADLPRRSSARLVVIADADPGSAVGSGRLRPDLWHRLAARHLALPPLRHRRGDIPVLMHHFAAQAAAGLGLPGPVIPAEALRSAHGHGWPGNVGELEAAVQSAVGRGRGQPLDLGLTAQPPGPACTFPAQLPTIEAMRDQLIAEALRRSGGDLVEASRVLGMSRWGLSKRLRSHARGAAQE